MAPMKFLRSDLFLASFVLSAIMLVLIAAMSILNLAMVNNILFPIAQYLPMFEILWRDNPTAAIGILVDKSVVAIGNADYSSGLYLWTLEFDTLSLFVFAAVSIAAALEWRHRRFARPWVFVGLALILFARTYGAVLAHCAGPTWLGFVTLYALGVDKFPVNSGWQWLVAIAGLALVAWQFTRAAEPVAKT